MRRSPSPLFSLALLAAFVAGTRLAAEERAASSAAAEASPGRLERLDFRDDAGQKRKILGRIVVEAADGGLLLQGQDGALWTAEKGRLAAREPTGKDFQPLSAEALGQHLAEQLGTECEIVATRHYVVVSRAGKSYAQWCGALFERLFAAFQNYWKQRGVPLREPEFPLAALVFANEKQFAEFATKDAGFSVASSKGYFSIRTNRIALYDLTSSENGGERSAADITRRLAAAPFNIATVIHEATHQIAFNSGMHTRFADNPLWLSEGMAMYFETPDLSSRSGWKTVGAVNDLRLKRFQEYLARRRPTDSLETLLRSDQRFTDADQMPDAYAEAWALSFFLIKARKEAYVEYLNRTARKPRLVWDDLERRLADFREAFGDDLPQLDADFVKYIRRLK